MFMFEALILGVVATAIGACSGAALAAAINAAQITIPSSAVRAILLSDTITLSVKATQIMQTVGLFTLFSIFASLVPATRAARMEPVKAIQHIG
jgi:ABC-type lipoprotein release transport system permease subunit